MAFFKKNPKQIKACQLCNKEFSLTRIRHKCKRCLRIICSDCFNRRILIVTFDLNNPHKACVICDSETTFQMDLINKNEVKWGNLSPIGKKWFDICKAKQDALGQGTETYADYLAMSKNPEMVYEDFKIIDRDVIKGRTNRNTMNYSMQCFFHYNQAGFNQETINRMISNVLEAYCMKLPAVGYTQGMNFIAAFLLTLMNEEAAFWVLCYVVGNVLPLNYYASLKQGIPLMGYQQEKFIILQLAKEILQLNDMQYSKVETFLEINGPALLIPLLVNYTSYEILFETWKEMITTNSFAIFRKVVIKAIELMLPLIEKEMLINPPVTQGFITRNLTLEEFMDAKKIQIKPKTVRDLEDKFINDFSSQWMTNEKHIYRTLQTFTHFSKNEIVQLQQEFNKYLEPELEQQQIRAAELEEESSPENNPEITSENSPDNSPEHIKDDSVENSTEIINENNPDNSPENMKESISENMKESVPESMKESIPESMKESSPESMKESSPEIKPSSYGIKKEAFLKIIYEVVSKDKGKEEYLKSFDLEQMFDVFDVTKTGRLDFKEFLFSVSMLMRGSLEERTQFAFQVFDKGEKGYLTGEEYEQFLKSIVSATIISNQGNVDPFFTEDLENFENKMLEIMSTKETITFMDIKKDLLSHEFIKYCDSTEQTRKRGETIAMITNSLNAIPKNLNRGSVPRKATIQEIQEDDEEFEDDDSSKLSSQKMTSSTQSHQSQLNPHEEVALSILFGSGNAPKSKENLKTSNKLDQEQLKKSSEIKNQEGGDLQTAGAEQQPVILSTMDKRGPNGGVHKVKKGESAEGMNDQSDGCRVCTIF